MSRSQPVARRPTDRRKAATGPAPSESSPCPAPPALAAEIPQAIARTRRWLLDRQHADGYWCAELEGDTILESETILLLAFLGEHESPLAKRLARRLLDEQLPEGGWRCIPAARSRSAAA